MANSKKVFVTGCSRGIGLEIAQSFLDKGWNVFGTANSTTLPDDLTKSNAFSGIYVDLADISNLNDTLRPLIEELKPDVIVNNAGIFKDAEFESEDDLWLSVWDLTMDVNLKSAALLCKWFLQTHIKNKTKGRIINIASRAAYRGDTQEYAAYAASKAGLVALTKSIARDYSNRGIVAYSVAPGFIETDMARDAVDTLGKEYITRDSVFNEITQPEEVAEIVTFLAAGTVPHATGQTFHINGGSYMI